MSAGRLNVVSIFSHVRNTSLNIKGLDKVPNYKFKKSLKDTMLKFLAPVFPTPMTLHVS